MSTGPSSAIAGLQDRIRGDVYADSLRLGMYATDASIYQILPVAVVCPLDEEDVHNALEVARAHKIPLLPRGGGTSLAGQTVAEAIVLDFSKYMNAIGVVEGRTVVVQPGVVRHQLNAHLRSYGLEFAPDPATSTRATVGGMISNNSSGTKSILYGKTSDHVLALKVMLANGTILHTTSLSPEALQEKLDGQEPDTDYYRAMMDIAIPLRQEVEERYPKTMRRVGGYALDDFLASGCSDLNRIFIGSEGTLGVILEARLNLVDLPRHKGVSVIQFDQAYDAIRAVRTMVNHAPAAVEILSHSLLQYSRKNMDTAGMCGFIRGEPDAIQMVEFYGNDPEELGRRAMAMHDDLRREGFGYAHDYYPEGPVYDNVWGIRERGLGLLLGEPTDKKAVPVIEDAAIPLEHLDAFIADVIGICTRRNVGVDYYAHASVGVIHIKPILDLRVVEDIGHFRAIADEVFNRVVAYKGSWSSEHGDGIVRSGYLQRFYGDAIYDGFRRIKTLFDPDHLMNPGKIIDPPPIDSHLRYGPAYRDLPFDPVYKYRDQRDFHTAVHQCSGLGACRKLSGGTMCPSFMVTHDEADSTRGRANVLRLAMSGQLEGGLANPEIPGVLDACISCKACKAECPSSVDMARLKAEVMQNQFDNYGTSRRDRVIARSTALARSLAGPLAPLVNRLQATRPVRRILQALLGFDRRRTLPSVARKPLTVSMRSAILREGETPDVILLADTYTLFHAPDQGAAAIRLLEGLGLRVRILDAGCCQRPRISHGFLREAAALTKPVIARVLPWLEKEIPVFVLEPSCASAWTDDLPDLQPDDRVAHLLRRVQTFENVLQDFLTRRPELAGRLLPRADKILLHGHCHQKSVFGMSATRQLFARWPSLRVVEPDSGCCGMAGSFGYEREHYDLSVRMADRVLVPAVHAHPDSLVIANGFSCRHQIADLTGRRAIHTAEMFDVKANTSAREE